MTSHSDEQGLGWTERWWYALGSDAHIQVAGGPDALADRAMDELERLEQIWSRFRPTSELQRLNSTRAAAVSVSAPMAEALHRAVLAWQLTDGWFDPTVIDSLEAAGYDTVFPSSAVHGASGPRGDLRGCRPSHGMVEVSIDRERRIVRRPSGVRFDLGGIGKGLAADHLAVWLLEQGATSVCIGLGGDIRVAGVTPIGGWHIPVADPTVVSSTQGDSTTDGSLRRVWFDAALTDGAIVTSTTRFRRWTTLDGTPAHHLIDPSTGRPSTSGIATVVVAAAETWWAEVLAKAALLAGPVAGQELLDRHGVRGWIVDESAVAPAVDLADRHQDDFARIH